MSGYSGKSLRDKLGIKSGYSAVFLFAPPSYIEELGEIDDIEIHPVLRGGHDFVHIFFKEKSALIQMLPQLFKAIKPNGSIWISWPKKTSRVKTDITENTIREVCLPLGLVDVKVAAIDDVWSGLKLVVRRSIRNKHVIDGVFN